MSDLHQRRKDDHVKHALEQHQVNNQSPFDDVRLMHHSFSHVDYEAIDLSTKWGHHTFPLPFHINGMTGGSKQTKIYNQQLAEVAREFNLAIATGSMSIVMKDASVLNSFTVMRNVFPNGFIMANLGAHHPIENAKRVIDALEANAIQIHLNTPQEVVMPEGDRDFRSWQTNIETMVNQLEVPVIVKEVGFGMTKETIQQLYNLGVQTIDVGGRGGTNFAKIENARRDTFDLSSLIDWGQTTPESLLEARHLNLPVEILASGGIKSPHEMIKALVMGAQSVGLAGHLLHLIHTQGVDATVDTLKDWVETLKLNYLLLNAQNTSQLNNVDFITTGALRDYQLARDLTER